MTAIAGGGTVTILNLFHLMSTTKTITIGASVAALLAIGTAFIEYNEIRQMRTALAAANLAEKNLPNRVAKAADENISLQAHTADLEEQLAGLNALVSNQAKQANAAVVGSTDGKPNTNVKVIHVADVIKEHPEYASIYAKEIRRNVLFQYGERLSSLNLPPDELARLKDLLVEQAQSAQNIAAKAEAGELAPGSSAANEARDKAQGLLGAINDLLQIHANTSFQNLTAWADAQDSLAHNYAPDFIDAGVPLSPAQSQAILQAVVDASYRGDGAPPRPADYNLPDPATGFTPKQTRIINQVAPLLSPAQLEIFKTDQVVNAQKSAIMNPYTSRGTAFGVTFFPAIVRP